MPTSIVGTGYQVQERPSARSAGGRQFFPSVLSSFYHTGCPPCFITARFADLPAKTAYCVIAGSG